MLNSFGFLCTFVLLHLFWNGGNPVNGMNEFYWKVNNKLEHFIRVN